MKMIEIIKFFWLVIYIITDLIIIIVHQYIILIMHRRLVH